MPKETLDQQPEKLMRAKGYSLWLMPTGEANERLATIIKRLSQDYSTPVFKPHLTLLGEVLQSEDEMIEKTKLLTQSQKSFTISLQSIGSENSYFRAVYAAAEPTDLLIQLHNKAREIFDVQDTSQYMPHLSLLYGDLPREVKDKIVDDEGNLKAQFEVTSVYLYKTDGGVGDWVEVREFPFSTDS